MVLIEVPSLASIVPVRLALLQLVGVWPGDDEMDVSNSDGATDYGQFTELPAP